MKSILKLLVLVATLSAHSLAGAAIVTYGFSGKLTSSLGSLTSGDSFAGTYTVDTSLAATGGSTSSFAVFNNLRQATLTIGSFSAAVGPGAGLPEVQQDDVAGADRYALVARNAIGSAPISGLDLNTFGFRLDDTTGAAISDALVLKTNLSLSDFTSNTFLMFFGDTSNPFAGFISGSLDAVFAVPEPGSLLLASLGLLGLARTRRLLR